MNRHRTMMILRFRRLLKGRVPAEEGSLVAEYTRHRKLPALAIMMNGPRFIAYCAHSARNLLGSEVRYYGPQPRSMQQGSEKPEKSSLFYGDDSGVAVVEYALALAVISLAAMGGLLLVEAATATGYAYVTNELLAYAQRNGN